MKRVYHVCRNLNLRFCPETDREGYPIGGTIGRIEVEPRHGAEFGLSQEEAQQLVDRLSDMLAQWRYLNG